MGIDRYHSSIRWTTFTRKSSAVSISNKPPEKLARTIAKGPGVTVADDIISSMSESLVEETETKEHSDWMLSHDRMCTKQETWHGMHQKPENIIYRDLQEDIPRV